SVLVRRRFRSLWRPGVAARYAAHPALPAAARRDPGDPAGATLGGSLGARLESASVIKDRRAVLGATLALIGLPVAIVPIEAFSFYSANRDNGSFVSSGKNGNICSMCRGATTVRSQRLSSSACTARDCGAHHKET